MSGDPHPEPAAVPSGRGRAVAACVGLLLAFIFVQGLIGALLTLGGVEYDLDPLTRRTVLALTVIQAGCAVAGLLFIRANHAAWRDIGLRSAPGAALRGWNAILPAGLVVIGPSIALVLATGDPLLDPDLDVSMAVALAGLSVAIGINEELWFRGLMVARLRETGRMLFAVLASALLFGLPHLSGDPAFILNAIGVTLAVGIPFACVRLRHGSLLPLIVMHVLIDAWAFLQTGSIVATGEPDLGEVAVGLIAPALLATGYLTWFIRTRPAPAPPLGS